MAAISSRAQQRGATASPTPPRLAEGRHDPLTSGASQEIFDLAVPLPMRLVEVVGEVSSPDRLTSKEGSAKIQEKILHLVVWNLKTQEGIELIEVSKIELLAWLSGMNQAQLAAAMGIGEGRLSEYLSGKKPIGPTAVRQFANALGVTPEALIKGKNLSRDELREELKDRLSKTAEPKVPDPAPANEPKPTSLFWESSAWIAAHETGDPHALTKDWAALRSAAAREGKTGELLEFVLKAARVPPERAESPTEEDVRSVFAAAVNWCQEHAEGELPSPKKGRKKPKK